MEKYQLNGDQINHPSHYNQGGIECLKAMESAFGADTVAAFCKCNAFKYLWRSEYKNGTEDIKKAQWYINKYLEYYESKMVESNTDFNKNS